MWHCKACPAVLPSRSHLLQHYRVRHYRNNNPIPCVYASCPCTQRSWNALLIHLHRCHVIKTSYHQSEKCTFNCHVCSCKDLVSERDYWCHIYAHLKKNEVVTCMFLDCKFQTNVLGSFKSHKCRKHSSFSTKDFKPGLVVSSTLASPESPSNISDDDDDVDDIREDAQPGSSAGSVNDLPDVIEQSLAAALLKLEHFSHVPSKAINDFLVELHHLTDSLSKSHAENVLVDIFQKHKLQVDRPVIDEIISSLSSGNQLNKAIERGGHLSSTFKRKEYYKAVCPHTKIPSSAAE